jgi:hypothetical protein
MRTRIRGLFQVDTVIPSVLVISAVVMSLDPTVFGVAVSERQIVLGFFGFLGVDALLERLGRLHRIEARLEEFGQQVAGAVPAGRLLRSRSSFDRMDVLVGRASRSVLIIGINLEGAVAALGELTELARSGGTVRLLAMDPDGDALAPAARTAGVDPQIRRQKIIQNLGLLREHFETRLTEAQRRRVSVQVADTVLHTGVVGLDTAHRSGILVVQHYLAGTPAERSPLLELHAERDQPWYERYLTQCETCLKEARAW